MYRKVRVVAVALVGHGWVAGGEAVSLSFLHRRALATASARLIEDGYVAGTRLRLRRVTDAQGGVTTKLGKKYPAEAERAAEAQIRAYQPPQFVGREITGDPHLTGFAIASSGSPAALLQRDS